MDTIRKNLLALRDDTRGVTALEYGLIAALLGAAIVTAFTGLGTSLKGAFTTIETSL